jgi:hypothetical protein
VPYILGKKDNPSYIVGGTFDIAEPNRDLGYILSTVGFGTLERLMLVAEIRLFANLHTPTYHAVIGDVTGADNIAALLKKLGDIKISLIAAGINPGDAPSGNAHWMPRVWPLPFWASEQA